MSGWSMTQGMHWQSLKANTPAIKPVMWAKQKKCNPMSASLSINFPLMPAGKYFELFFLNFLFFFHNLYAFTRTLYNSLGTMSMVH